MELRMLTRCLREASHNARLRDFEGGGVRLFCLLLPCVLGAQTAIYAIRPAQESRFALQVFKSKLWEGRKHTFVFDRYSGALSYDREQPERSAIRFVVETASVRCVDDWVKPNQIKDIENAAKNLMAAESYKQMMFQSTAITVKSSEQ